MVQSARRTTSRPSQPRPAKLIHVAIPSDIDKDAELAKPVLAQIRKIYSDGAEVMAVSHLCRTMAGRAELQTRLRDAGLEVELIRVLGWATAGPTNASPRGNPIPRPKAKPAAAPAPVPEPAAALEPEPTAEPTKSRSRGKSKSGRHWG